MKETRTINDEYTRIAMKLIKEEEKLSYIDQSSVTILCLSSDKSKKTKDSIVHGECERIDEKYKWAIPADFTITIYEPNVASFSDDQIKILIFHELLHVGIEYKAEGESYYCRDHEYEDFGIILDRYGRDWAKPENEVEFQISDLIIEEE